MDRIPPCLIFIDKEGRWYHKGAEIIRRDFVRLFYQNMRIDPQGRYLIEWDGRLCYVDVEDTAFVVRRVTFQEGHGDGESSLELRLSDDTREPLSPETLFVGKDNVLYCRVKSGLFPARFNRAAYYQLAEQIEEDNGAYFLVLNGRRYPVKAEEPKADKS